MKTIQLISLAAALAAVSACGQGQPAENTAGPAAGQPTNDVYSGTGTIRSIAGNQIAIAHGPIAGIGWPAMTMTFTAPPNMAANVKVGSRVHFSFRRNGSGYVLTAVKSR